MGKRINASLLSFAFVALFCVDASAFAFRGRPPTPTVGSTTYIDPTLGSNGAGTCGDPKNTWVGLTLGGNAAFLQKGGTTWTNPNSGATPALSTSSSGTSLYAPLLLGTYDSGGSCARITDGSQRAIINVNSTSNRGLLIDHSYVTVDSLEIKNSLNGACIHNAGGSPPPSKGMIIKNNYLHNCRDSGSGAGQGACTFSFDDGSQILDNVCSDAGNDGFYMQGNYPVVMRNTCSNVSIDASAEGDCLQFSDDTISTKYPYAALNSFNHSSTDAKACILANLGTSPGVQFIRNTCVAFPSASVAFCYSIGSPNSFLLGNTCQDSWRGMDILAQSTNLTVAGNLFVISGTVSNMKCMADNGTTAGVKIFNNTCVATTPDTSSVIGISSVASATVTNNIIKGFNTAISGSPTESFNDCFDNTTGCAAGSDITTDPLFVGSGVTPYNLQAGSGAKGTGTTPTVVVLTPTGIIMKATFDMGAYWASRP